MMRINIYGLGYVGCVSAACLANNGHDVIGIDIDDFKLSAINAGKSPIVEPKLQDAIQKALASKRLKATDDQVGPADVSMICVGTPSNSNGSLQLDYVIKVVEQIGAYLRTIDFYHVVNIRSTVLPGTVTNIVIPLLEKCSKKTAGRDFGVCMNPEFMREGNSIADFYKPIFSLIGELDEKSGNVIEEIYKDINAPIIRTNIEIAEMIKYSCNAFHAIKVVFANEIGNICKIFGIDSHKVMEIFCMDTKLNLSSYYFKPGFAFGGSCLPKDMRALLYKAAQLDLETPLLRSILISNNKQIDIAFELIRRAEKKSVGVLGLSFKAGTDDLRESPMVELIERLIGKGYAIKIYDEDITVAKIFGANKKYIEAAVPHIACLLKESIQEVINHAEIVVIGKKKPEFADTIADIGRNKIIIDLVHIGLDPEIYNNYQGICW
jgi:GDP-mannose 6-dehydrogenase